MPQILPLAAVYTAIALEAPAWAVVLSSVGGSILSGLLTPRPEGMPTYPTGSEIQVNTRSEKEVLKVVYGTTRVGGNDVFAWVSGANNETLWLVQTFSEGECSGIANDGVDMVYLNGKRATEFDNYVNYWFYSGSADQTYDTHLNEVNSDWTDNMQNTTYIVWKFTYNRDYFTSLPERQIVLNGRLLYDFRDYQTGFSRNPVLAEYDIFTNSRYGAGVDESKVDANTWTATANYCDAKGWYLDLALVARDKVIDVMDLINSHIRSDLIWYNGKLSLKYNDINEESTVMDLGNDHVAQDSRGAMMLTVSQPSASNKPTSLNVVYTDPDKDYSDNTLIVGEDDTYVEDLHLPGCTSAKHAGDIGTYHLERAKLDRLVLGTFRDDTSPLEPHNLVNFTNDQYGFPSLLMRVMESEILPDGLVNLVFGFESEALYNDRYDSDVEEIYSTTIVSPTDPPAQINNVTFYEEAYLMKDRTYSRLWISWELPSYYPFIDHVEVWISEDEGETYEYLKTAYTDTSIEPLEQGEKWYFKFITVNIWGVRRDIDTCSTWVKLIVGQTDLPADPTDFYALIATDTAHFSWGEVETRNIVGYELRWGDTWIESIFVLLTKASAKVLPGIKPGDHTFHVAAKTAFGVYSPAPPSVDCTIYPPAGYSQVSSWTFNFTTGTFVNTERKSDYIFGWVLQVYRGVDTWNGWTGSNESTIWTDLAASEDDTWEEVCRIRYGYWESPVQDLGSDQILRYWTEYELAAIADLNSWNSIFGYDENMVWTTLLQLGWTWNDLETSIFEQSWRKLFLYDSALQWIDVLGELETWERAFAEEPAGTVWMELYHKKAADSDWTISKHLEILSTEVEARYVKLRIHLRDYNLNSRIMIDGSCVLRAYGYS